MKFIRMSVLHVDFVALLLALVLASFSLSTMYSGASKEAFFERQAIWVVLGVCVFFAASLVDWRFLRRSVIAASLYSATTALLGVLFFLGVSLQGAQSWFDLGVVAFQPSDLAKLVLIIVLAKYFSRRHIEIANVRHILVSGLYAGLLFILIAVQPDFGSAVIIFLIWFGMVFVSGISRAHIFAVLALGCIAGAFLWLFGFQEYQKERVLTFLNPLSDIHGAGYNVYQSTIAVGSGEVWGKGIGYGTQSKLKFLPEYETDFIFASYAEEWGFVGVLLLFASFGLLIARILSSAAQGASNFETLFALGVSVYFMAHFGLHVGINLGILPVTGTTLPFMSYGGSHVLAEFLALGIISGMRRYRKPAHRESLDREFRGGYDR